MNSSPECEEEKCWCKLCMMRELPDVLDCENPSWNSILQVSFFCLQELFPEKEYHSLKNDLNPFLEKHWTKLYGSEKIPQDYKQSALEALSHNKKWFTSEHGKQSGWKMKKLMDPWKAVFSWSAGNLYTQTKKPKNSPNQARNCKRQKVQRDPYLPDEIQAEFCEMKKLAQERIAKMRGDIVSLRLELHQVDVQNYEQIQRMSETAGNWESTYGKMDFLESDLVGKKSQVHQQWNEITEKIQTVKSSRMSQNRSLCHHNKD